jgi:hypothetical protein
MAKKNRAELPLAEELLDRGVALLEGPLNRVVERVLKSRVVLVPVGLSLKVALKTAALVVPPPPWMPTKPPPPPTTTTTTATTTTTKESTR